MSCFKMFGKIISQIFLSGLPSNAKNFARCFLTVSLAIPVAVALSQCTCVGGCLCPISSRISRCILASLHARKRAPNSASAADATTNFNIRQYTCIVPFSVIGVLSVGVLPRKKYPATWLRAFAAERYDASECIFNIMFDARYRTVASGWEAQ